MIADAVQAEEERDDMEKVKLDNKRILFNLLPAHVAQHFLMSNPRNMVSIQRHVETCPRSSWITSLKIVTPLKPVKTRNFPELPDTPRNCWFGVWRSKDVQR